MKPSYAIPLIAIVSVAGCTTAAQNSTQDSVLPVSFTCENGEQLEMRFFPEQGIGVLVRNGKMLELKQQRMASGFLYSDGTNVVRGKGDELSVEIGRMAPIKCKA